MLKNILLLIFIISANVLGQQTDVFDWPQLGRTPQRCNYTPEKVGNYYTMGQWKHRWLVKFDSPVAQRITPVMAEGVVAIGTYDGIMHCIDFNTGNKKWIFQAKGPIEHCAAIQDGVVYFSSADWSIYAVSIKTGEKIWSYKTERGIVAAPLVVENRIYVGSKDGYFYCFNSKDGNIIWKTDLGEPVNVSAVWSEKAGLIFTGTAGMNAVCLNKEGKIIWKRKLPGQSLQEAWPQIGERWGVVIYRSLATHIMWDNIDNVGNAFQTLFTEEEKQKVHFVPWEKPPVGKIHHSQYAKENWTFDELQNRIQDYLLKNPDYQTFFALDINTGKDKYKKPVPVLYTWGVSQTMNAQAIDNIDGRAWAVLRGWQMLTENGAMPDLGALDLSSGRFRNLPPFRYGGGDIQPGLMGGDEHTPITAAGDTVFHGQNRGPGGWSYAKLYQKDGYPDGYYKTFKVMGMRWKSRETLGKGDAEQNVLDPTFIRSDSQVIYTHGNLIFQVGGGVTCWVNPGIQKQE